MKICRNCGTQTGDEAQFCPGCGAPVYAQALNANMGSAPVVCQRCGMQVIPGMRFCTSCGAPVYAQNQKSGNVFDKLNDLTGVQGNAKINLRDLFSDVFKHHTPGESDKLFICGTEHTTPSERDMVVDWPKPWLYTRIFLLASLVFAALAITFMIFKNTNVIPGMIFFGAIVVPLSYLVFIWECNIPRNISLFSVMRMLFLGGAISLFVTLALSLLFPSTESTVLSAIVTSVVEETAKALIVIHYIRTLNTKYILNGILIGAAVGAGFAVFETAGYIFNYGLVDLIVNESIGQIMSTTLLRGALAIGGHCVWAAIIGGAVASVKHDKAFSLSMLSNSRVWALFAIPLVLHALWDMPFNSIILLVAFTAIALIVLFFLLSAGIREVRQISEQRIREEAMEAANGAPEAPTGGGNMNGQPPIG